MFTFNNDSGCVKVWIDLITKGIYKKEDVPELYNLKECVYAVLDDIGFTE